MINFDGLLIGIVTFLIIGLFHPVVVKAEYYWGTKCWWIFLVLGILGVIASLFIDSVFVSAICGVFAFSSFWTIKEIFEQEERVQKGWFPRNPKYKSNKAMKRKRKKQDPLVEYIKANRKGSREAELENHGRPVSHNRIHVSKKVYNRKRMKADAQRHLPYLFLVA